MLNFLHIVINCLPRSNIYNIANNTIDLIIKLISASDPIRLYNDMRSRIVHFTCNQFTFLCNI